MSQLSCLNIQSTLEAIQLNDSQLWGLVNQNNTQYCNFTSQMGRLFSFQDFTENLTNPLYQAEIIQDNLNMVFLPICYAYSILRVCMVVSVMCYVNQKMNEIFNSSHKRFPSEKQVELNWYKRTIYASMIIELICALRDFILFKGTLLFTNLMDSQKYTCYVNIYDFGNIDCDNTYQDSWRPFSYNREQCNCLYYTPSNYLSGLQYNGYMTFNIFFWVITESLTQGLVAFTILILSRLNKEEKSGWPFIKPTFIRVIFSTCFIMGLYFFLIYGLDLRIYYRFYNLPVIVFFFCQKCVIFLIIFDRLYSKIWLELKLRLPILHSSGIDWSKNLEALKRMIMRSKQPPQQIQEIYKSKYRHVYEQTLNNYYDDSLRPYVDKYEREYNSKMKTQWYDYLNYLLLINLIGIIGYAFLGSYGLFQQNQSEKHQNSYLFWIGFILALVELIVFEVSNIVFQLHCFLIELYKQCEEEFSTLESNQQDSGLQGFI